MFFWSILWIVILPVIFILYYAFRTFWFLFIWFLWIVIIWIVLSVAIIWFVFINVFSLLLLFIFNQMQPFHWHWNYWNFWLLWLINHSIFLLDGIVICNFILIQIFILNFFSFKVNSIFYPTQEMFWININNEYFSIFEIFRLFNDFSSLVE